MDVLVRTEHDSSIDEVAAATLRYAHLHTLRSHLGAVCVTAAVLLGFTVTDGLGLGMGLLVAFAATCTLAAGIDAAAWQGGRDLALALSTLPVSGAAQSENPHKCIAAAIWLSAAHDRRRHRHLPSDVSRESAAWLLNRGLGSHAAHVVLTHPLYSSPPALKRRSCVGRLACDATIDSRQFA